MKQKYLTDLKFHRWKVNLPAFFLIVLMLSIESLIFGQENIISRAKFSNKSLLERALAFEKTFSRIAFEERVDPLLLWTIAYNETRFRPWLRSPAGAEGLMQFMPATAARFNLSDPYRIEASIKAAARYVRFLANRFGGRIDSILAGYNAGEGAVDAYLWGKQVRADGKIINSGRIRTAGGIPPYRETVRYVAHGLLVYRLLQIRQVFSPVTVRYLYPPQVSGSVARVELQDNEISFNGSLLSQTANADFWKIPIVIKTQMQSSGPVTLPANEDDLRAFSGDSAEETNQPLLRKAGSDSNISVKNGLDLKKENADRTVFYEPRTGARYRIRAGSLENLAESGELIIGQSLNSQLPATIRARGTFFGRQKTVPK